MKKLLWLDIETTGLDPAQNAILEVSAIVTDDKLNELAQFSEVIHWSEVLLNDQMNDWCRKTHHESGLIKAVQESKLTRAKVSDALVKFIEENFGTEKPIMCGNSIHFDRSFLQAQMPGVIDKLHYRMIDVSGMNELFKITKDIKLGKGGSKHRGLPDVRDSIELGKKIMERVR